MRRAYVFLLLALAACRSPDVSITAEPPAPLRRSPDGPLPLQGDAEIQIPKTANGVLPPGAADKILPAGSPPLVRLLEPGADPRADLSYALVKGATQRMAMGMDMAVAVKVKGQANPMLPMPHMTINLDAKSADRNAGGEFKIESKVSSVGVEPTGAQQEQMARALRPQMETMKGLGIGYWVTPKGQVRDVKLDMPAGAPPAAQQLMAGMSDSFEAMVVPLPAGAVGVGGRWQVITRVTRGGTDLLQSAIYTVKSRSGSKVVLESAVTQAAGSDVIHTPQMPPGMNAKLRAFSSGGTGTTNLDLTSVVPESGATRVKTVMTLVVDAPGADPDESTVDTTTSVQFARP